MEDDKKAKVMKAGVEAGNEARKATIKALKKEKVTIGLVAQKLYELLDAKETKVHYDTTEQKWKYSKDLVKHSARKSGIKIAATLLDINPSTRHDVNLKTANFNIISNVPEPDLPPPEDNNENYEDE